MPTRRQQRLNELLREELALVIAGGLDDPRISGVAVTRVETTRDMTIAKVYISSSNTDEDPAVVLKALDHAKGLLRSQIGDLGLRRIPDLVFSYDRQYESGERVIAILAELNQEDHPPIGGGEAPAEADRPSETLAAPAPPRAGH